MEGTLASTVAAVLAAAFLVGVGFGVLAERTGLCTMGAIADAVLFGGRRRARLWAGAVAVAALGLNALVLAGALPASSPAWRADGFVLALGGGLLFGAGMVTAGGCVSRACVRAAAGSVKGLAVLAAAAAGIALAAPWTPAAAPGAVPAAAPVAGLLVAVFLAAWVLRDAGYRRRRGPLAVAAAVGVLVILAHLATVPLGSDGVRFVLPLADAARGDVAGATPGLVILAGVVAGAAASAWSAGRRRGEPWVDRGDVVRHLGGGLAMGVGGTWALGCTIGAGVTGVAVMAPGAWLALAGMVLGAVAALKVMLAGGPAGAWQALRRAWAGP
jgi:hypothetical protein